MKKIGLTLMIVFLSLVGANAQTSFGIKGGLNVSSVRIPNTDLDPLLGFHIGGFASTPISSRFSLQPEVLYSQQGVQTSPYKISLNYLNVPLIFKGTISGGLHAQVGPQFGILLKARREYGKDSRDITDELNRYDAAIALGLGYDVSSWQVSARYNLGLSDIRDNSDEGITQANNVFQLSLGYRFR